MSRDYVGNLKLIQDTVAKLDAKSREIIDLR